MTLTSDPTGSPGPSDQPDAGSPSATSPGGGPAGRVRPPRWRTSRRSLIVAVVVLMVVEIVAAGRLVQVRSEQQGVDAELSARQADLAELRVELAAARRNLADLQADAGDRQAQIDGARRSIDVRKIEVAQLSTDLEQLSARTQTVQEAIDKASTADKEQIRQLVVLTQCLNGIRLANLSAAGGRPADTVAALRGVQDVCQQALAIVTPGTTADFPYDFADPSVIYGDGRYWSYATNGGGGKVQVISSTDLKRWQFVGEALARLPGWAVPGYTWAPSVFQRDGTYYLFYTARHAASGRQCISVGVSSRAAGPFVDDSAGPMVCQLNRGGSIDPSPFVASDGKFYLLWKSEGEVVGGGSLLWSGKLTDDFKGIDGEPSALLGVDQRWEGRTIEAPSMAEANGTFFLFYSGNRWDTEDYAVGYAVCSSPTGPCRKPADNVILAKHDTIAGPGGAEVFVAPGGALWMSYHAWTAPNVGYPNKRQLHVERLTFPGNRPKVG